MISLNDVLLAMSNIPVDDPIAEIWGRGLQGGYKIIEYTGTLPITINANGDVLLDYRIYGASGGVGEPTENLLNPNIVDEEQEIRIESETIYTISRYVSGWAKDLTMATYDENGNKLWETHLGTWYRQPIYCDANTVLIKVYIPAWLKNAASLVKGFENTPTSNPYPTSYIPHGYKLPMTVSDGNTEQSVPVYIGENQLDAGEYVSYGEQKIYRDVDGTLTPTDPPVPFPDIPTIKGETVIDYDGDPKPSQMYAKYKGKSDGA